MSKGTIASVAISSAIALSSVILSLGTYGNHPSLEWATGVGLSLGAFGLAALVLGESIMTTGGMGAVAIGIGLLSIVAIAGTVWLSSKILNNGDYKKYPTMDWSLGVGLSLGAFGLAALGLGAVILTGIGALALAAGLSTIPMIADSIVDISYKLAPGNYTKFPTLGWATGVGLSLGAFGLAALGLGAAILTGVGALALAAGLYAMPMITNTIITTSEKLSKGNYTKFPTLGWATGVGLSLTAFATTTMAVGSFIIGSLGIGAGAMYVGSEAIKTISHSIVDTAEIFASGKFSGGPTKDWAEGVGGAIGAFAPVYKILSESKGLFSNGPDVDSMKSAIITITNGIIESANTFGENTSAFDLSKIPSRDWGENVGKAIIGFIPALEYISKNTGTFFGNGTDMLTDGIKAVTNGIKTASLTLAEGNYSSKLSGNWVQSITGNIKSYVELAKYLIDSDADEYNLSDFSDSMVKLSDGYSKLADGVSKLNNELTKIDVEKLTALKSLSGTVVLLSLMDSGQFEDMMDALEDKAKIFVDVMNDLDTTSERLGKGVKGGGNITPVKSNTSSLSPQKTLDDIFTLLQTQNQNLNNIAKNSENVSKYLNEMRGDNTISLKNKNK